MKKLVLAYSGGLDTSYCLKTLSKEGYEVHAVSVNTGGFSEQEIIDQESKAMQMGASTYTSINALESFYQKIVKYLVFGNVLKNNSYPLSVSAERIIQAVEIISYAKKIGAQYIAHGSTGAGNDQVRFDLIFQVLAPGIEIITPIRDQQLSREAEIEYLKSEGIELSWEKAQYSINQGLWGTSVGGSETLTSHQALPSSAYPSQLVKSESKKITLDFEKGELKGIDGVKGNSVALIQQLQEIAKGYAIGRDIHVGDTIIGIKGRVGFEAAAPLIIIKAHHLLEKHTLSKWQQFQKEQMGSFYGMQLHEGNYLDPVMRDIESFLESSQKTVNGSVTLTLHPYRFEMEGIQSPNDLMNASFGSYGEMNKGWTADDAKGFIKITANAHTIYGSVNNNDI
ncbi:argininosuccinate synthase [Flavobacteriaceae bacterium]|uniref:argininosuccinate synthase n=1 Tax=Candidatus Arcticimaribacter forsetii TaxID=2820661 RepID=UPI002076EBBD|nr:argininosuccinate synthase domain-containing protein [Candidatus Arcticimaribacter forsetii]MDA8698984.1 argininosuccinate synthase [Flavobacteriaceae bacterium]MDB2345606.1 argininosuccinate synthase [Flavobacteriaceae bacterium]MDB4621077.1 argininosuccinate synthase [Flavobacteriaceae bacterium]MDB4716794.1 argininosuccinate synthase [Flavobacteriaceae bacterium]MDB4752130.1 argininosuccinate synthase [Flavobacteriaceae bacterium]